MKNIVLTTLFAGCFAVSSVFADDAASKSGCMTFNAKVSTGVAFAGKVKTQYVTYGTAAKMVEGVRTCNNLATKKNTKKKSSAFIGITLGTKYNFNDQFALGADIFYDAMNVKFQLKDKVAGLEDTAKIRGAYGLMAIFAYKPFNNFSLELGAGIAKTSKIKDLYMAFKKLSNERVEYAKNANKFKNKFGFVAKIGMNYLFNDNLALGLDVKMQKVKAKSKKFILDSTHTFPAGTSQFKCNLYTIAATLTYTF